MNETEVLKKQWWQSKTVWLVFLGLVPIAVTMLDAYRESPIVPDAFKPLLLGASGVCALLGNLAARQGGVEAAKEVAVATGQEKLLAPEDDKQP